jgi:hypothetical protein
MVTFLSLSRKDRLYLKQVLPAHNHLVCEQHPYYKRTCLRTWLQVFHFISENRGVISRVLTIPKNVTLGHSSVSWRCLVARSLESPRNLVVSPALELTSICWCLYQFSKSRQTPPLRAAKASRASPTKGSWNLVTTFTSSKWPSLTKFPALNGRCRPF